MRALRRLPRAQNQLWKNNLRIDRRKALRGPLARSLEGFCCAGWVTAFCRLSFIVCILCFTFHAFLYSLQDVALQTLAGSGGGADCRAAGLDWL